MRQGLASSWSAFQRPATTLSRMSSRYVLLDLVTLGARPTLLPRDRPRFVRTGDVGEDLGANSSADLLDDDDALVRCRVGMARFGTGLSAMAKCQADSLSLGLWPTQRADRGCSAVSTLPTTVGGDEEEKAWER